MSGLLFPIVVLALRYSRLFTVARYLTDSMHRRPSAAVAPPPLPALSLPPRPREMSAILSANGSAPHTPTKRAEPLPLFTTNTNRYSTDSWNSSNYDVALDPEAEWKPEQLRLLTRVRRPTCLRVRRAC